VQLVVPDQSSFKPTASAIRVNILWLISFAFSTVSALWATLLQQWIRRYAKAGDRPDTRKNRARIRAFLSSGVEHSGLGEAVEMLPGFLHISFLLFYLGLVDFFFHINHIVAHCLLALVSLGVLLYVLLSITPLYYPNSPYHTPLTPFLWFIMESAPLVKYWLRSQTEAMRKRRKRIGGGMRRAIENRAFKHHGLEAYAMRWTLTALDGDHKSEEELLHALPGIFHEDKPGKTLPSLRSEIHGPVNSVANKLLASCLYGFLPEPVKKQRLSACLGAIWCFPETAKRHCDAIWTRWTGTRNHPWAPLSAETWSVAENMTTNSDPLIAFRAHCVQAMIAAMWCNGRCPCPEPEASTLLQHQLNASTAVLKVYLTDKNKRNHLQLAVAANLLSNALRLLPQIEPGPDMPLRLKAILDMICDGLDVSDIPDDLRARFVDRAEVMKVYGPVQDSLGGPYDISAFDVDGPWTKVWTPI
jgi:Family of unknown function (DUF6535)